MPIKSSTQASKATKAAAAPKWSPEMAQRLTASDEYVVLTQNADGSFALGKNITEEVANAEYATQGTKENPFVLHPGARLAGLFETVIAFSDANADTMDQYGDVEVIQVGQDEDEDAAEEVEETAAAPAPKKSRPRTKKSADETETEEDSTRLFEDLSNFLKQYRENPSIVEEPKGGKKAGKAKKSGATRQSRGPVGVKRTPKEVLDTLAEGKVVDISGMNAEGSGMRCVATPGERSHKVLLPAVGGFANFRVITDKVEPVSTFLQLLDVDAATIQQTVGEVSSALSARQAALAASKVAAEAPAKTSTAAASTKASKAAAEAPAKTGKAVAAAAVASPATSPKAAASPPAAPKHPGLMTPAAAPPPKSAASPRSPRTGGQVSATGLANIIRKKK